MAKKTAKLAPNDRLGARKELTIDAVEPEQARRDIARLLTSPPFAAARAIQAVEGIQGYGAQLDTAELLKFLRVQAEIVNDGDMAQVETMLLNQATALQSLFARLLERGMNSDLLPHYEAHMRLALRAQAQCRATLETLAAIKNPPVVFARQANIAQQQQVNNGPAVPVPTRARDVSPAHNELLEQGTHERLDFGTQGVASGADSQLATVGTVHRPQD